MNGLMQDYPLTLQHLLWRMEKLYHRAEVVSRLENGVHRETYGDLVVRANRLANALTRLGVKAGDRVGVLAWNSYRYLELYYAVPCMGAVIHTLNLRLHPDQLAFIVEDAQDKVVFVDASLLPLYEHLAGRVPSVAHVVRMADRSDASPGLLDYEELLAAEGSSFPWPRLDERAAAGMCYTSGTTGNPKGVVYSHRSNFLHTLGTLANGCMEASERSTILAAVPMFHANAWGLPYTAGMAGSKMVMPGRFMGDPAVLYELASAERATILAGVPTIFLNFVRHLEAIDGKLPDVKKVICGGAAAPPSLIQAMDRRGLPLVHAWGMTETSPVGTLSVPRPWHEGEEAFRIRCTQGAASACVELRIADMGTGAELPWDGVAFGEVQVRGPWIASGYHGGGDADKFTRDGWFRTGDVASVDGDGFMTIVDRAKDVIKSGGEWISSLALEAAIMSHPSVVEAAVIGLAHPTWQERPVAYVVRKEGTAEALDAAALTAHLSERVARWWLPDEIRFIDELPRTSVGKFDKRSLRATAAPLSPGAGTPGS